MREGSSWCCSRRSGPRSGPGEPRPGLQFRCWVRGDPVIDNSPQGRPWARSEGGVASPVGSLSFGRLWVGLLDLSGPQRVSIWGSQGRGPVGLRGTQVGPLGVLGQSFVASYPDPRGSARGLRTGPRGDRTDRTVEKGPGTDSQWVDGPESPE